MQAARDEQDQVFADWERDLKRYEQDRADRQAELDQLRQKHEKLTGRFLRLRGVAMDHVAEPLVDYADFDEWRADNQTDRIWFAPKALKAMTEAQFWKPDLIADALIVLDCFFSPMKRAPGKEAHDAYRKRL